MTSLLAKAEVDLGSVLESELGQKGKYGALINPLNTKLYFLKVLFRLVPLSVIFHLCFHFCQELA